jgi:hypothetical protein
MILQIWRTRIDQTRADEYRDFAHSRSLPMFRARPGFPGVLFAAHRAERAVITLWRDLASVEAFDHFCRTALAWYSALDRGRRAWRRRPAGKEDA